MKTARLLENFLFKVQCTVLSNPYLFGLVLLINLFGVVYGFYWYKLQLSMTPIYFWIFTPDCPGAVFLFLIWVLLVALKLPDRTFKVIAVTALIKYGIWTVSVIGLLWIEHGIHYWQNVMLFISHIGMVILGVVFAARIKINGFAFWFTAFWLLLNDFIDYYFEVYPWLPDPLRLPEIRLGTFILSGLIIVWMLSVYRRLRTTN